MEEEKDTFAWIREAVATYHRDVREQGKRIAGERMRKRCENKMEEFSKEPHPLLGWIDKGFDEHLAGVEGEKIVNPAKYRAYMRGELLTDDAQKKKQLIIDEKGQEWLKM